MHQAERRLWRSALALSVLVLAPAIARAQSEPAPATGAAVAELGRELFHDPTLSIKGTVSCATCHDSGRSFVDGTPHAVGQTGRDLGVNTPTLFASASVGRFVDPRPRSPRQDGTPKALTLAERCLMPMENPAEMGNGVDEVLRHLGRASAWHARADEVFGEPRVGLTRERLGAALAAYVESVPRPDSAWQRHLESRGEGLGTEAKQGYELFSGKARCTACHSGPALTDGKLTLPRPPGSTMIRIGQLRAVMEQQRAAAGQSAQAETVADPEVFRVLQQQGAAPAGQVMTFSTGGVVGGGGGYGGAGFPVAEVQTPTLIDVARTAPYFRDGSEPDLAAAVRRHVDELREVDANRRKVLGTLAPLDRFTAATRAKELLRALPPGPERWVPPSELPDSFAASLVHHPQLMATDWVPPALEDAELASLLAFLRALSPADGGAAAGAP